MGSAAAAAWIAYIVFVALLVIGLASGELSVRGLVIVLIVCVVARVALAYASYDAMFPSVVAIVDVVLVLIVVKRDVPL